MTLPAFGSAGTSQKTASAPANASATTDGSLCEPRTTSARSATPGASRAGSRATTRTTAPLASRFWTTWRPMPLVGAVTTIIVLPWPITEKGEADASSTFGFAPGTKIA